MVVEPFYTVSEVALMMRVSRMTVYRLVQSGALDSIRFGRSYRVPKTAIEQYLYSVNPERQSTA
ncbi:helix-turn-helix domain-containing protein [Arthrobacter sp. CAN_A214]|uniref:helix-turn-helix domain-containing protein n=1 Tax=Arthrobacter sp. CAN_A214 TaxID=2787720 RepID=UPI0018CA17BF